MKQREKNLLTDNKSVKEQKNKHKLVKERLQHKMNLQIEIT